MMPAATAREPCAALPTGEGFTPMIRIIVGTADIAANFAKFIGYCWSLGDTLGMAVEIWS